MGPLGHRYWLILGLGLNLVLAASGCSSPAARAPSSPPVMPAALGRVNLEPALGRIISSVCSPTPDLKLRCPLYTGHKESFLRQGPEAAQAFQYTPDRGELVVLEQAAVTPARVSQGGALQLSVTYTVLRPTAAPADLLLIREVTYRGQAALPASHLQLNRSNGTFGDQITLTLPVPLLPGPYTVITKILGEKSFDSREQSFLLDDQGAPHLDK